jgi:hypothetical protein
MSMEHKTVEQLVKEWREEGKRLVDRSEELANNGEAHRSDILLARGRELEGAAMALEQSAQGERGLTIREAEYRSDHYFDEAAPAASAPPHTNEAERAWLIERAGEHGPEWATSWSGGFEFTTDSLKAIRFCRREDANQVAEILDGEDVRITEHQWG